MTRAQYIKASSFTVVFTPHFIGAVQSRKELLLNAPPISSLFERLWAVGIEDTCTGCKYGKGYIYYKCKWNVQRNRWELELISFTPAQKFHTHSKKYAVEVCP